MEMSVLGQWYLPITCFSPLAEQMANPCSASENSTWATAVSQDRDTLNIRTKAPGRLLIDYFSQLYRGLPGFCQHPLDTVYTLFQAEKYV